MWNREKARSPSPTFKSFGVIEERAVGTAKVGRGKVECMRVECCGIGSGPEGGML